ASRPATSQKNPRDRSRRARIIWPGVIPFWGDLGAPGGYRQREFSDPVGQWTQGRRSRRGAAPAWAAVLRAARPARRRSPPRRRPRTHRWGGRRLERLQKLVPGDRRRALPGAWQPRPPLAAAGDNHVAEGA